MRRRGGEYDQSGVVNLGIWHRSEASIRIIVCRRRIGKEYYPVVEEHRIPRGRKAAIFCGCPGDDNRIDTPLTQYDIQVRSEKAAVTVFLDNMLAGCGGESGVNVHA